MQVAIILISALFVVSLILFVFTAHLFKKVMGRANGLIPGEDSESYESFGVTQYKDDFLNGYKYLSEHCTEPVYTEAFDGIKLAALFIPHENARATVLMMHGFRSAPEWDFSCAVKAFHSLGLNVLLPYQRAHGKSEGKYLTFGIKERYDVHSWIKWLTERFGEESDIFLDGVSMGCATVLMGSGGDGYPENVRGIIADCGYSSPYEIVTHVMKSKMHLPKYPFIWYFRVMCRLLGGFSLTEYSPLQAMKENKTPVIFFHGEADDFVPPEMSLKNHEACVAEKQLVTVEKAGHGLCYLVDRERCEKLIGEFIDKNLRVK